MARMLVARIERFPVQGSFTISRGAKTHVDVVVAEVTDGPHTGRGEGTAIYYKGDSAELALAALTACAGAVAAGAGRADLLALLPAGAARNALDCALWDLEAKQSGRRVWQTLGLPVPQPMLTAYTISLADPAAMAAAASAVRGRELLKVKLGGEGGPQADVERMAAVRRAAPDARLIVDANEAWGGTDIERTLRQLAPLGVELVEQPVPAGRDVELEGLNCAVPLAADESCHDRDSLDAIIGRYRFINIKLDKAGGLTEALALRHAAATRGLGVDGLHAVHHPCHCAGVHGRHAGQLCRSGWAIVDRGPPARPALCRQRRVPAGRGAVGMRPWPLHRAEPMLHCNVEG